MVADERAYHNDDQRLIGQSERGEQFNTKSIDPVHLGGSMLVKARKPEGARVSSGAWVLWCSGNSTGGKSLVGCREERHRAQRPRGYSTYSSTVSHLRLSRWSLRGEKRSEQSSPVKELAQSHLQWHLQWHLHTPYSSSQAPWWWPPGSILPPLSTVDCAA